VDAEIGKVERLVTTEIAAVNRLALEQEVVAASTETTARYTRVATGMISKIESPLDGLSAPRLASA
jgi:hypothetical protein